jgi:hypothetical protein
MSFQQIVKLLKKNNLMVFVLLQQVTFKERLAVVQQEMWLSQ